MAESTHLAGGNSALTAAAQLLWESGGAECKTSKNWQLIDLGHCLGVFYKNGRPQPLESANKRQFALANLVLLW